MSKIRMELWMSVQGAHVRLSGLCCSYTGTWGSLTTARTYPQTSDASVNGSNKFIN